MRLANAEELVRSLSESRSVEVKRWIDVATPEGQAKIIRGLQALRNYNGGQLVIGFDNSTLRPDTTNVPHDVRAAFHADIIQELTARYSSEPFDVEVLYPMLDGQEYVVIEVPSGVRSPVAAKKSLSDSAGKQLVSCDDVYFRTLSSNNTVSTAKIPYRDWPDLVQICFENREADIGRFLRRHLSEISPETIKSLFSELSFTTAPAPSMDAEVQQVLDEGRERYLRLVSEKPLAIAPHGSFEVGFVISGIVPRHGVDVEFLRLLDNSNPRLTGWPVWLDSSGFRDETSRPYVLDNGWEALIVSLEEGLGSGHIDFMRKVPTGRFYLRRALQDDLATSPRAPSPNTALDFGLAVLRTAEAIAVGKAFARALGCVPEETRLEFGFRWSGLTGRVLTSWANPGRSLSIQRKAVQDEITCRTTVPLFSSSESIAEPTYEVVSELFALFEGFVIDRSVVEDLVARLLERRL